MKVIILAGGFGTRLSEHTDKIPKPMVTIGEKPIIWHIMNHYESFGFNEFFLALGYKAEVIKEYFLNYHQINSDIKVDISTGKVEHYKSNNKNWKVSLINTGLKTMTGGRLKKLKPFLNDNEDFLLTYGDGLSDVNIEELIKFHKSHGKLVTITAVRPSARFGELSINMYNKVTNFQEKPQTQSGWINGGFFVMNSKFIDLIDNENTILENEPLEKASELSELMAFKHNGFWQCMDTKRDRDYLNKVWSDKKHF